MTEEDISKEDQTPEEKKKEMEEGEQDEDVYSEEGREQLMEDREIEDWEEGFMEGAEDRGEENCCVYCGKLLGEEETKIFEREFSGEVKKFCSEDHAQKYADRLEKAKEKREALEKQKRPRA